MKTRAPRGFTLLEMMISLLVLAVGALGLLRLETALLHSQIAANDYNTATNLAQATWNSGKPASPPTAAKAAMRRPPPAARWPASTAAATPAATMPG
ncbi:Tfp pilus assembly protein PilV [Chromobacterium violaceum]|uniref:Tfp pilus assembly protein PilV n=1 Tax=Chromobacterium violaceum TaxID=536 RepID=A0A3S4IJZ3_CHRVL|nr:Tfp pilus assembly protein PilV [Chromobacterium violaceum]